MFPTKLLVSAQRIVLKGSQSLNTASRAPQSIMFFLQATAKSDSDDDESSSSSVEESPIAVTAANEQAGNKKACNKIHNSIFFLLSSPIPHVLVLKGSESPVTVYSSAVSMVAATTIAAFQFKAPFTIALLEGQLWR